MTMNIKNKIRLKTKEQILTVSMLAGTAIAILIGSFAAFSARCDEFPERLFRMHILANSDSEEDQALKYALRDYLSSDMQYVFEGCQSAEQAKNAAKEHLPELTRKAQQFVYDSGFDYTVTASVERTFFTTRRYGGTVVPAGEYNALRILIGEGEGQNWWCVMFPPLCLGAVEEYMTKEEELIMCKGGIKSRFNGTLSAESSKRIQQGGDIEVRFALYEWLKRYFAGK